MDFLQGRRRRNVSDMLDQEADCHSENEDEGLNEDFRMTTTGRYQWEMFSIVLKAFTIVALLLITVLVSLHHISLLLTWDSRYELMFYYNKHEQNRQVIQLILLNFYLLSSLLWILFLDEDFFKKTCGQHGSIEYAFNIKSFGYYLYQFG